MSRLVNTRVPARELGIGDLGKTSEGKVVIRLAQNLASILTGDLLPLDTEVIRVENSTATDFIPGIELPQGRFAVVAELSQSAWDKNTSDSLGLLVIASAGGLVVVGCVRGESQKSVKRLGQTIMPNDVIVRPLLPDVQIEV